METSLALGGIEKVETYILAAAVALARMVGLVLVMPAFTRLGLSGILRSGVALTLSLPLVPMIFAEISANEIPLGQMAAILFKEVMVGIIMALILGVPIWAAEAAGEILDLQRGLSFGDFSDPLSTTSNNITGEFFAILMVAIFFTAGGLHLTLRTAYESYALWPLQSFLPMFSAEAGKILLGLLDEIFSLGLMLVVPLVIALLLADLSLAFIARAAPQMNIFILSLTAKNLALAVLLVLYCTFLITYMRNDLAWLTDATRKLEAIAPPKP